MLTEPMLLKKENYIMFLFFFTADYNVYFKTKNMHDLKLIQKNKQVSKQKQYNGMLVKC